MIREAGLVGEWKTIQRLTRFTTGKQVAGEKALTHSINMERFRCCVPATATAVDVGCGPGRVMSELARSGYGSVIGFDFSSAMVARGRAADPGLDLRVAEGAQLPLGAESVDAVLLLAVLTCVPGDEAQVSLIQEIHRVLGPGGSVFVTDLWLQNASKIMRLRP